MSEHPHEAIRLDQFLKKNALVGSGGEAKMLIQGGEVKVNGAVVTQRGRKLRPGDVVEFAGTTLPPVEGTAEPTA